MRAQTKIWISIAAALAVSAVIVYFAFSSLREMSNDFARYQGYSEIINEAFALNILIDDALKEEPNARKLQQIGRVRGTLSKALESISFSNSREESLIRQIRRNNLELGPLIEQLFNQKEGSSGSVDTELKNLLASQLWVKVRFIIDDVNRLMETSGTRIVSAQVQTSLIVLILIAVAMLSNAIIYFFSSRSIVRAQEELRESQRQAALLADLMESSSQPFGTGFPDGRLGMCNKAFPRLLGYSKEELFALGWVKDLTPPEWLEKEAAILEELHRTDRPVRYEKEYRRKDGTRVPVEILVHLRRDEQGEPAYYYAFITDITERKRAEAALRQSEEHYRHLFDNMLNGYAYCQMLFEEDRPVDFIYLNVNHAFEVLTGLTDVKGKRVSEVVPGLRESDPQLLETFSRVSLTGIAEQFETHVEALDMWFFISVYSPKKDHFVAIFDVITERKQAEQALQESREDLNRAQAVAHTGSWRMNVQKNELTWSEENHRIFGIPQGTPMTYETFLGTVHPEDRKYVDREWMAALRGAPYDIEHRIIVDGAVKWVRERAELEFDSEGHLLGGFGTTQDITERKHAEEEIKRLASFPEMNPSPVIEIDLSGSVTYYNRAALKFVEKLGPGVVWGDILPEDLGKITAAAREKKAEFFYREVKLKETVFSQNIYFAEPFQVLRIYSMDITKRQQAEEQLRRTLEDLERSNQELEGFAYVASHDLQEPLRKMANFSEMLSDRYQGQLDERADKYLGYIADGAERMKLLINDLLALSRVGRADLRLTSTDMHDIFKGVLNDIQPLVRDKQAEITCDPLPVLKINPHLMGQVLQNLIANAIKFHSDQPPRIHVSARQEGREWVMAVRDNGIGFEPQYAESIFKVFRRLHTKEEYPGTGIGLAICKKIVERHGGRIWAESEPGKGTTVYFTIPA
jgi:PAS domain S-box-containing protein